MDFYFTSLLWFVVIWDVDKNSSSHICCWDALNRKITPPGGEKNLCRKNFSNDFFGPVTLNKDIWPDIKACYCTESPVNKLSISQLDQNLTLRIVGNISISKKGGAWQYLCGTQSKSSHFTFFSISIIPFPWCRTVFLLKCPRGTFLLIVSICLPTLTLCKHAELCVWKHAQRLNIFLLQIIWYAVLELCSL